MNNNTNITEPCCQCIVNASEDIIMQEIDKRLSNRQINLFEAYPDGFKDGVKFAITIVKQMVEANYNNNSTN